jgi:RNA-directed DNA polymerase
MHGCEKSDSAIVAVKPPNKTGQPAAEAVERRAEAKENASQQRTFRTQCRERVSQALGRIRKAARQRKTVDLLRLSFLALKRDAAPGGDGVTWQDYEADLERKLTDLHARVHRGAYRAQPSRRRYIPKADGRQRPLAVAALEDKIVQRATAAVLNQIYEEDFLGFSYGFRPKRSQHDALDALMVGIRETKGVSWIIDELRRAAEPHYADEHAPVHPADECVLKEARKPHSHCCAVHALVQFRPYPQDAAHEPGDGCGGLRSVMVDGGHRRANRRTGGA